MKWRYRLWSCNKSPANNKNATQRKKRTHTTLCRCFWRRRNERNHHFDWHSARLRHRRQKANSILASEQSVFFLWRVAQLNFVSIHNNFVYNATQALGFTTNIMELKAQTFSTWSYENNNMLYHLPIVLVFLSNRIQANALHMRRNRPALNMEMCKGERSERSFKFDYSPKLLKIRFYCQICRYDAPKVAFWLK